MPQGWGRMAFCIFPGILPHAADATVRHYLTFAIGSFHNDLGRRVSFKYMTRPVATSGDGEEGHVMHEHVSTDRYKISEPPCNQIKFVPHHSDLDTRCSWLRMWMRLLCPSR